MTDPVIQNLDFRESSRGSKTTGVPDGGIRGGRPSVPRSGPGESRNPRVRFTPDQAAWGFVLLGSIACLVRYGLRFPIWPDEAFVGINLARRDLFTILEPLEYHQVAPPLFLMIEEVVTSVLGFSEWSLRLFPLLCAIGALVMFRSVAKTLLAPRASVLAVGILSVSYWVARYGAEVKPYSVDLLLSVVFIWLALRWRVSSRSWVAIVPLCVVSSLAFGFSFPAVFVGGGVVVFMAISGEAGQRGAALRQAVVVGLCLTVGFAVVYFLHTRQQMDAEIGFMRDYWGRAFPPVSSFRETIIWLLRRSTGEMMPYPVGGKNWGSTATLICVLVGSVAWLRSRRPRLFVLLTAPIAIGLAASMLHRYPFGAPTRCQLYLAPIFCLFAGIGLARLLEVGRARYTDKSRYRIVCAALVCVAGASMVRDVVEPAKTTTDETIRDFARVVWPGAGNRGTRTLCLREDLGGSFWPDRDSSQSLLASFLCNYYIYARPNRVTESELAAADEITVVTYLVSGKSNRRARQQWIDQFETTYGFRLEGDTVIPVPDVNNWEQIRAIDTIEIMQFSNTGIVDEDGAVARE